jgi:hypothetical protein
MGDGGVNIVTGLAIGHVGVSSLTHDYNALMMVDSLLVKPVTMEMMFD